MSNGEATVQPLVYTILGQHRCIKPGRYNSVHPSDQESGTGILAAFSGSKLADTLHS